MQPSKPSSNIHSFTYDAPTRNLAVTFHNGHIYTHHDVPAHVYDSMKSVFSVGRYYHTSLKRRFPKFTITKPEIVG